MKILPDGTVEIKNKHTGESKIVKPEDLPSFGISYTNYADQKKAFDTTVGAGSAEANISNVQDVAKNIRNLPSSVERNNANDALLFAQDVKKAKDLLSQTQNSSILGARGTGPLVNFLKNIAQTVGVDTKQSALQDQLTNIVQLIRKERTGVAFAPAEQKELEQTFGNLSIQEGPLKRKLDDLLARSSNEVAVKGNMGREQLDKVLGLNNDVGTEPQPTARGGSFAKAVSSNPILNLLLGGATRTANDIVQGATSAKTLPTLNAANSQAQALSESAMNEQDPEKRKQLLQQANQTFQQTSQQAGQTAGNFTEGVGGNPLARGLGAATEVTSLAELPALLKSVVQVGKGGLKAGVKGTKSIVQKVTGEAAPELDKSLLQEGTNLAKAGGNLRNSVLEEAGKAGKTVDGTTLANQIKEWGRKAITAGEDAKTVTQQVKTGVANLEGKVFTPSDAKEIWDAASQGFKANGQAGNTVMAGYQRALRDTLRKELDTVAPGFEKGTAQIAEGLTKDKLLKQVSTSLQKAELKKGLTPQKTLLQKIINPATIGSAASTALLFKLLGIGRGAISGE